MIAFFIWWLCCYIVWAGIMFWSDWTECDSDEMRAGFLVGIALLAFLWPVSVASHVAAETAWGRARGMSLLFERWRK